MENIGGLAVDRSVRETNLWRAIRRHWLPAIAIATAIFAISVYKTSREIPNYQSQTIILVANKTAISVVGTEDVPASTDEVASDLSTEIEILRSPTLLAKALKKLPVAYRELSLSQLVKNLSLRQVEDANVLLVSYTDTQPERAKAVLESIALTYIDYGRESQRSPITNAIRFIEEKLPEARVALNRSSMAITDFRKRNNLDDPDRNAAIAFQTKEELQQKVTDTEIALNQIEQQYRDIKRQIAQTGQDSKTALLDSVLSQDTTYQNLVNQLRTIELQYALLGSRFQPNHPSMQELEEQRDKIHRLLQNQIQRMIGTRKSKVAEQSLVNGGIQQNLAVQMLEIENNLHTQTRQLNDLRRLEAQSANDFQRIVQLQQDYTELQRQYKLNSLAVDDFLAKLQELRLREAQEISSWKVIEPPYLPTEPISPNLKRSLVMGGVTAILGGLGVAFWLEQGDRRIRKLREVRELTTFPILGVLPKVSTSLLTFNRPFFPLSGHFNLFTEAIRSVALALRLQKSDRNLNSSGKIFVVTSATAGEGKSTITFNLGLALAELGHRVLIVDAHFNRPSLHQIFVLPNETGLSTALTTTHPWREFIHSGTSYQQKSVETSEKINFWQKSSELTTLFNGSHLIAAKVLEPSQTEPTLGATNGAFAKTQPSGWQHLDIMTSGPELESAVAWLSSPEMFQLLEHWHQAYDYVLMDTAPITERADVHSLIPKVDEVILVIGMERLTRRTLSQTIEILQRVPSDNTKVLVNFLGREDDDY